MVLICALSGEATSNPVVTPSGRICDEKLLLSKLADNGGSDPFTQQPLDVDSLVHIKSDSPIIPPRPSATSMPSLLQLLNTEYSALVLELFDTRQLLEETRKELSQALYQGDAAVRVIARVTLERDEARQELSHWKAAGGAAAASGEADGPSKKRARAEQEDGGADGASEKRPIPASDVEVLAAAWQRLSQQRKASKKQVAAAAPASVDEIRDSFAEVDVKRYHKSSGKQGVVDLVLVASEELGGSDAIVTAGKDKQVCVFQNGKVVQTYAVAAKLVDAVVVKDDVILVAAATATKNQVVLYQGVDTLCTITEDEEIVGVSVHPSAKYVIVTTPSRIAMYSVGAAETPLAYFESSDSKNVCGSLHPDGFIYAVGLDNGQWSLWDFKSQTLAATLGTPDSAAPLLSIVFSNNGYHVATATGSAVTVWDLKKQASLVVLDSTCDGAVAFDASGKYLAYASDENTVEVAQVKDWTNRAVLSKWSVSHLAWSTTQQLVGTKATDRAVKFYGKKAE